MHARPIVIVLVLGAVMTQLAGCQNHEQALQGLLDRQQAAWADQDRDAVLSVAEAISERDITGPSGYWYYRLKVQSYQLVGQHEDAYAVLRRHDELTVDDYLNEALPPNREGLIAIGALTWAVSPAAQMLQIPERPARPPGQIDRWWEQ